MFLFCYRVSGPLDCIILRRLIQTSLVSLSSRHTDVLTSNIGLAPSHIHLQLTCQHVLKVNCPVHEIFTSLYNEVCTNFNSTKYFNHSEFYPNTVSGFVIINPLNAELNPICYLLALLAHHFLHFSRIRVK